MINFTIKKVKETSFYDLAFTKKVHKRTGEIVEEPGDTIHGIPLNWCKHYIAIANMPNKDYSLKDFFIEFHKSYEEVCESLKKIL